ncbi:TVP38/TMEM64 family protein [Nibricoccus sp. IMCC34717]|uniref:TVP38/TMEM64 family protein n=1 Tax=Nibricoccus sp. IMCC34717 TaxID=3034021 RepID=UPI00384FA119
MSSGRLSRPLLVKLAIAVLLLGVVGVAVLKGLPLRAWVDATLAWLRTLGPVAFFACMVLLPVAGFPMLAFTLSAAPLFAEQLGMPLLLVCVGAALAGNVSLSYWLARYGLRPLFERIVKRLGYTPPVVEREDEVGLIVLVRVTPGPPFFVQNYLLGLAEVRFGIYLGISWAIAMVYTAGVVFFGDAIMHGTAKGVFLAVSMLVAAVVGVKLVRRHLANRKSS